VGRTDGRTDSVSKAQLTTRAKTALIFDKLACFMQFIGPVLELTGGTGDSSPLRLSVPATVHVPGVPEGGQFLSLALQVHTYFRFFLHLHDVERSVISLCSVQ